MTPTGATEQQRPNLVIAGVAKAATTSLFRYLGQHPDVYPSGVKETRYFSALRYGEPLAPLEEYTGLFAHGRGHRYRMEATPGYFPGGAAVADAIDELLPDSRVIVSLRDPVRRCWSWYTFMRSTARIPKDLPFEAYLDRCVELHDAGVDGRRENQEFWGLGGGCYDHWIDDWLKIFDRRFRVQFFEHLVTQPQHVTEALCRWLDLDPEPCARFDYAVENQTVQYRNRRMLLLARTLNTRAEPYFARHPQLKRALRRTYYLMNADTQPTLQLEARSRERLMTFYAPHNERLAASLTAAGYERLPDWLTSPDQR